MQPHQYLGTNAFPDVDLDHSQLTSRSPPRAQHTNAYHQVPSRVHSTGTGLTSSTYVPVPALNNTVAYSPDYSPARSVTSEPWEAATSEFQVPTYRHEMPTSHYESQFSVNSVHDSLRDTGPWAYNPDDDRESRVPVKRQISRSTQAASTNHEGTGAAVSVNSIPADDSNTSKTGIHKTRTAEQKASMARSAANRRANDKDHLSMIKERLPSLAYGQEYNNRTALAGALARFDKDEETIRSLKHRCFTNERRLKEIEEQLATERTQKATVMAERDVLLVQRESIKAIQADLRAALTVTNARQVYTRSELDRKTAQYSDIYAAFQHHEAQLRYYREKEGAN
ncbi:hypothetical protein DENSPDRAFT_164497 [Dentipellis sp. KUC8613]|nr:hypothetical protein DENSPDRAFT_164497 [Dentipellis sp. KUC8613]